MAISLSLTRPSGLASVLDSFTRESAQRGLGDADLSIAGVAIRLSFAGQAIRERLLPALAHRIQSTLEPDVRILIMDRVDRGIEVPRNEGVMRVEHFVPSRSLSIYDSSAALGAFLVPRAEALPSYERAAPLRTLLHWILEPRGCRLVHAAAVATSNGGALLIGRGGSGKSTTALLCAAAGLMCAGDDYVGITLDDAVEVHSIYGTAKVHRESLDMMPELHSNLFIAPHAHDKGVVFLPVARSFPVRALIVPSVTRSSSRLRRIGGAEALRALAPTTLLQLPGSGSESLARMAVIARSLPAWALDLGNDRENIPALVARAIEESR